MGDEVGVDASLLATEMAIVPVAVVVAFAAEMVVVPVAVMVAVELAVDELDDDGREEMVARLVSVAAELRDAV